AEAAAVQIGQAGPLALDVHGRPAADVGANLPVGDVDVGPGDADGDVVGARDRAGDREQVCRVVGVNEQAARDVDLRGDLLPLLRAGGAAVGGVGSGIVHLGRVLLAVGADDHVAPLVMGGRVPVADAGDVGLDVGLEVDGGDRAGGPGPVHRR